MAIAVHNCDPSTHDTDAGSQKLILGYIAQVVFRAHMCVGGVCGRVRGGGQVPQSETLL